MKLSGNAGTLTLSVADDGVGFDPSDVTGKGLGLVSIRERVEAVGGSLDIRSSASGTELQVVVPVRPSADVSEATA